MLMFQAGRLDAERRPCDPSAAASSALFFRHRHHPAADPSTPPILGQEEPGDVDELEFGSSVEPADDPTGLRTKTASGRKS
jgi:hypothetical protein